MAKYFLYILNFLFVISCSHTEKEDMRVVNTKKRELELGQPKTMPEADRLEWHLNITKTQKAWQISKGAKDIVVAIIDTGIDIHHPDLKDNLWVNTLEKNGKKGVDDDENGLIDDIHGWNFADGNENIMDYHGHGTHVAGIIGGTGKKCQPGISPKVSLMILKYYSEGAPGSVNLNNTIRSINYAIQKGAHIINFSGGGPHPNEEERQAIELALEKNILFVTAAGNEHSNIEKHPYYPASYNLSNILSVGASDRFDKHSQFSNKGNKVTAHAPGTEIYSTLPGENCGRLTGTSQATPIFTGGAVLLKHYKKLNTPSNIIKHLSKTTDIKWSLKDKSQTGGRANLYKALGSEDKNIAVNGVYIRYFEDAEKIGQVGEIQEDDSKANAIDVLKDVLTVQNLEKQERTPSSSKSYTFVSSPSSWTQIFLRDISSEKTLD